jgi:hypothetical protein
MRCCFDFEILRSAQDDVSGIDSMVRDDLVDPKTLAGLFERVAKELYRYPAVDPRTLRAAVERLASRG